MDESEALISSKEINGEQYVPDAELTKANPHSESSGTPNDVSVEAKSEPKENSSPSINDKDTSSKECVKTISKETKPTTEVNKSEVDKDKEESVSTKENVRKRETSEKNKKDVSNPTKDVRKNEGSENKKIDASVSSKESWSGRLRVETLSASSSSEDVSASPGKTVKRRKKRPKDTSTMSAAKLKKIGQIQEVLASDPLDMEALRELAVSDGGLVRDDMRRRAWPKLMMMEQVEAAPKPPLEIVKAHKEYTQVVLDVQRSLKRFPPGIDDDYREVLMDQLTVLIIRVLMKHPHLHYYQGYHDVAITFLLVMGEDVGYEMMEKLSMSHLCEFMRPTMERTTYYLTYLYPILRRADPALHKFINDSGVGTMFCLPWLITWFAHTLADYRNVVRLYDFFLASPYLMPMYIATAIVLQKKEKVLAGECEMAMQHYILSQVPDTLPFEDILVEAGKLHEAFPPDTLTLEVEEHLKIKAEEEKLEKQRIMEKKKKYVAKHSYKTFLTTVLNYIPPQNRRRLMQITFFAVSVVVARGLYCYYYTSGFYVTPDS